MIMMTHFAIILIPDDDNHNGMVLKTKIGLAMIMILMALLMTG